MSIPSTTDELVASKGDQRGAAKSAVARAAATAGRKESGLASEQFWQRRLQGPQSVAARIIPPPKVKAVVESSSSSVDLGIRLVGTMFEPGFSFATLVDRDGRMDTQKVGQELGLEPSGVKLTEIAPSQVKIVFEGREQSLKMGQSVSARSVSDNRQLQNQSDEQRPVFDSLEDENEWLNGIPDEPAGADAPKGLPAANGSMQHESGWME
jgi:hypothetical protein